MTTCASGVHYMQLVDHARAHIEKTYRRPLLDRAIRAMLAAVLPYPERFRAALGLAKLGRPFAPIIQRIPALKPLAAMTSCICRPPSHWSSTRAPMALRLLLSPSSTNWIQSLSLATVFL